MPSFPVLPTDVLVASAWLARVPGFSAEMTGPRLPPDVLPDGTIAPWVHTGFATAQTVGGGTDPYLPVHFPVMQVDCWAVKPGSSDPPWHMADAIGEAITLATWQRTGFNVPLDITVNGVQYPVAVVQAVYMATPFRRLYADEADYARTTGNLALTWVMPSLQIP